MVVCSNHLELARLHGKVNFAIVSQVRGGLLELAILCGNGVALASHFGVISAETVVQSTAVI